MSTSLTMTEYTSRVGQPPKAVLVRGDTSPHAEVFKEMNGKWNTTLNGWIFSKAKRSAQVQAYVDKINNGNKIINAPKVKGSDTSSESGSSETESYKARKRDRRERRRIRYEKEIFDDIKEIIASVGRSTRRPPTATFLASTYIPTIQTMPTIPDKPKRKKWSPSVFWMGIFALLVLVFSTGMVAIYHPLVFPVEIREQVKNITDKMPGMPKMSGIPKMPETPKMSVMLNWSQIALDYSKEKALGAWDKIMSAF